MKRLAITLAAAAVFAAGGAASGRAEDPRQAISLPPDVRAEFMEEMRGHMDALDDVIASLAAADFGAAATAARDELGIGSGKGFGRFLPREFRELGMAMHRSALDFADVAAAVGQPPTAAEWRGTVEALQVVSSTCRGCHAAFRLE